jgi:hypothetical protein
MERAATNTQDREFLDRLTLLLISHTKSACKDLLSHAA